MRPPTRPPRGQQRPRKAFRSLQKAPQTLPPRFLRGLQEASRQPPRALKWASDVPDMDLADAHGNPLMDRLERHPGGKIVKCHWFFKPHDFPFAWPLGDCEGLCCLSRGVILRRVVSEGFGAPRRPQTLPRWPQRAPRCPEMAPRRLQEDPNQLPLRLQTRRRPDKCPRGP